jgi:3-methyladenine DNA glycosylase/8-oxoguanine DNA glycosylase
MVAAYTRGVSDPVRSAVSGADEQPLERAFRLATGADPALTLRVLWQGPSDPQMRVDRGVLARASRFASGPAALRLRIVGDAVIAQAWGAGAAEALEAVPSLIGERDDPSPLIARHRIVADAQRRLPGLRLTSGAPIHETLLISILGQKITSFEARRSFAGLVRRFGEQAPGPLGLWLPPPPEKLARLPYWALHALDIERRRADTIRAAAAATRQLERLVSVAAAERIRRLMTLPGVGPWTAAEAARLSFGDPDAVSIGDYHLPRLVCWALAGEPAGDDARMLELLEPYSGQRARVVLLIENSGLRFARRGPRMAPRSIAAI